MRRALKLPPPSSSTVTAVSGMNLGSVVMMVRPAADWGSSSRARVLTEGTVSRGRMSSSMNFFTKVLLPVRTGPTTPM